MPNKRTHGLPRVAAIAVLSGAAALADCSSHPDAATPPVFHAGPPQVYVAKVKNLLIGKPPTEAEIQQVATAPAPPAELKRLIGTWMQDPAYDEKMRVFFALAFQQTQLTTASFIDMLPDGLGAGDGVPLLVQNIAESFARTMVQLTKEGKPLNVAMTTRTYMMTPALLELYAFLDEYHTDDQSMVTDGLQGDYPDLKRIVQGTAGLANVTIAQSVDPTSPYFMQFYNSAVGSYDYMGTEPASCNGVDPIDYAVNSYILHWMMYGAMYNHGPNGICNNRPLPGTMMFAPSDFTTWKMVTVRPPNPGEQTTRFFDIPALRAILQSRHPEIVIRTPRLGFFSTPAFFGNWPTNTSNQMRVTANQALIVTTGMYVDASQDPTMPGLAPDGSVPSLDTSHAMIGTACYGCHSQLDPTRAILSATWTYPYYTQLDPKQTAQTSEFVFQGVVNQEIHTIGDFAQTLASHPLLPGAWVEKLCYYANSQACQPTDPEYLRIVGLFKASNLNWTTLVTELMASPLTTNAVPTQTTDASELVAVARRDHLCAALNKRLNLVDVCGLQPTATQTTISTIVGGLPSDAYGRGAAIPVLPSQPTLFYRGEVENICEGVARIVIDNPSPPAGAVTWTSSATPDAAIADFVSLIMGIESSDARSAPAHAALKAHFTAAIAPPYEASMTTALQSTFTAACLAPSFVGIGM